MNILVVTAHSLALKEHATQKYGEHPYSKHLGDVVTIFNDYRSVHGLDESGEAAAWLHDIVEDTPVKAIDIYDKFGKATGDIVFAVTNENGRNRKERTVKTMLKVKEAGQAALAVKLCDRIANARFSREQGSSQYQMYKKEYPFLRWFLRQSDVLTPMWNELDELLG